MTGGPAKIDFAAEFGSLGISTNQPRFFPDSLGGNVRLMSVSSSRSEAPGPLTQPPEPGSPGFDRTEGFASTSANASAAPADVSHADHAANPVSHSRRRLYGLICGLVAAVCYTLANMALRHSARPGDFDWSIWITFHKAIPATVLTWGLVWWNARAGRVALPALGLWGHLIVTGLIMQFGGNLCFQYALSLIGLAMSVPLTFASILLAGALFSRLMLGEPLTARSLLAISTLMISVWLLSGGAGPAAQAVLAESHPWEVTLGLLMALIGGASYGYSGVVIRKHVQNLPVSATLVHISTVGVVAVGAVAWWRLPWAVLAGTTLPESSLMLLAGGFNAIAFYCIGVSFRFLNVNQVNMINTTQIAMATLAGVLFFAEPLTTWLVTGVLLTICGWYLMDRH